MAVVTAADASQPIAVSRRWRLSEAGKAAAFIVLVHAILTLALAWHLPVTKQFDEIAHYSAMAHQRQQPELFPHYERQVVLAPDLKTPTAEPSYISHPSFYYLLLSPLTGLAHGLMLLRLVNVLIAYAALAIVIWSGWRLLEPDFARVAFAVLAASFPKFALIAAVINNDNLAALAGALVFAGLAGAPAAPVWIAVGLILAGWTKLTAFIALAGAATLLWCWRWWTGTTRLRSGETVMLLAALAIGAIPYVAQFIRSGEFVYFSTSRYWVAPAVRAHYDFLGYIAFFFHMMAEKWPAAEATMPVPIETAWLVAPLLMAAIATRHRGPARPLIIAYFAALAVTLVIHIHFGWRSFNSIGDLDSPQTRYYNILWPGIALGGAIAIGMIARRSAWLAGGIVALYVVPTAVGGLVTALI